ncbi:site-specific integrase [Thalassobium sp. R2A62]|uniref:site-specific integrase n=1 Tax=Thalassobium sp. R2A62 TaxID=633131 RepID=UPI0001B1CA4C|nr:site-specific integrase [Thalassobium sp. R2A62]EET47304.1 site-specific recombinase, phage integrase family [Thalassobium sp. R2A62]
MPIKVIIRQHGNLKGERAVIPINDDGSYDWYGWMWSASNRHLTPSSIEKMLQSIMPLKLWAQFVGIDVEKEMVHGECLSSPQIEDFKSFIPLYVNDLRSLLIAPPIKLNDWLLARETVSDSELRSRRLHTDTYLRFLGEHGNAVLRNYGRDKTVNMQVREKRLAPPQKVSKKKSIYAPGSISQQLMSGASKGIASRISPTRINNAQKFVQAFFTCDVRGLWPDKRDKAKKSPIALRNEVFLRLVMETSGRISEVRELKWCDFQPRGLIKIRRRHNDPDNARARKGNTKTNDREIVLHEHTFALLEKWEEMNQEIPHARTNDFIFLSLSNNTEKHKNKPISKTSAVRILEHACGKLGTGKVNFHAFRHLQNQELSALAQAQGWTNEEYRKVATYINGWSPYSEMTQHYSKGSAFELSRQAMKDGWSTREALTGPNGGPKV